MPSATQPCSSSNEKWSLFPIFESGLADLFWPIECHRSNSMSGLSLGISRPFMLPLAFLELWHPCEQIQASLLEDEIPCKGKPTSPSQGYPKLTKSQPTHRPVRETSRGHQSCWPDPQMTSSTFVNPAEAYTHELRNKYLFKQLSLGWLVMQQ